MRLPRVVLASLLACAPFSAAAETPLSLPPFALARPVTLTVPMPTPRPPIQYASLVTSPRMRIDPRPATQAIPNAVTCHARDLTGQLVPVRQRIGKSRFYAHANLDVGGVPTITYGHAYFGMSPTLQRFASLHECGHLVLRTYDEFEANCHALRHGNWTAEEVAKIREFHERLGAMPANYGKNGPGFWHGTMRACPEFAAR